MTGFLVTHLLVRYSILEPSSQNGTNASSVSHIVVASNAGNLI